MAEGPFLLVWYYFSIINHRASPPLFQHHRYNNEDCCQAYESQHRQKQTFHVNQREDHGGSPTDLPR